MWKTKSSSYKQYLFGLHFSRNAMNSLCFSRREGQINTVYKKKTKVYYKSFYPVCKETPHRPLKVAAAKKYFSSVHIIDTTCFDECFLIFILGDNLKTLFFTQIYCYPEVWYNHTMLLRSLK